MPKDWNHSKGKRISMTSYASIKSYLCLAVLFVFFPLFGSDTLTLQKCMVTKSTGNVLVWQKDKSSWMRPDEIKECKAGHSVKTEASSQLIVTLEPAISATIEENSVVSFDKLIINRAKKNIRMLIREEKGIFRIKMEPLFGYTALLTLTTPSATIDMNSAEAAIQVVKDTTKIEIVDGSAKVRPTAPGGAKSLLSMGTRAVIYPNKAEVAISSLAEDRKSGLPKKDLKVAILSIQSSTVAKDNLERVSDFIAQEVERKSSTRVLFLEDIRAMLQSEGLESLLGCYTDSCISRIGNVLGIDAVIVGGIGQLGNNYLFSLKMIDVLRNSVTDRQSVRVTGDMGKILDEIPTMIGKIVEKGVLNPPNTAAQQDLATATALAAAKKTADTSAGMAPYRETLVWIKGGTFVMGSRSTEGEADESPPHTVQVHGFYMDKYEVTRDEYEHVMGTNPSTAKGCGECPVDNVSWNDAQEFCTKVGKRLPTEAEWEYACKAGTATQFFFGNTLSSDQANFNGKFPYGGAPTGAFRERAVPVGSYKPNVYNLYDMHGNVAEWCLDWYDPAYYGNSDKSDPLGPKEGKLKVVRGGSWNQKAASLRSARRAGYNPTMKLNAIGFRCVKPDTAAAK
jgi:formylglycine-generating enzyme required for sulfatase activity